MKEPRKNPFFLIITCMLLLLLSQTAAAFAVVLLQSGSLFQESMSLAEADAAMLEMMFAHQTEILMVSYIVVLGVLWLMARRRKQPFSEFTGLKRPARMPLMVLAAAAGLAAAFWATIAINLIPWPEAMMETYEAESAALSTAKPVLDFLAIVFLGPLVEEVLFRGIIYDALCLMVPAGAAAIFQGLLFGSVHGTMIWMIYAAFMGCMLGYVRKRTGSVRPCLLMHMVFNASSYLFGWFADRFGEDHATITFVFIASAFVLLLSMYGISFRTGGENETKN